jgi:hypothetical protein
MKKGAHLRPALLKIDFSLCGHDRVGTAKLKSGYVYAVLLAELPLDGLHLVLEAELQLLQTNLFQFFVFAEISFLGE